MELKTPPARSYAYDTHRTPAHPTFTYDATLSTYVYDIWMLMLTLLPVFKSQMAELFTRAFVYDTTRSLSTGTGFHLLTLHPPSIPTPTIHDYAASKRTNESADIYTTSRHDLNYATQPCTTATSDATDIYTYDCQTSGYNYDETEAHYYGYRYYSAENGRWASRDPIGETIDPHLYAYCVNSPINWVDPDGRSIGDIIARFRARLEQLRQLVRGARVGLEVRGRFQDMIDQYVCCPASGSFCAIDKYDGVLNGTPTSWTIAHRITGCRLKGEGVSLENMALLNGIHETFEFFRPWGPEVLAFIDWDEVGSYDQLVNAMSQSVIDYMNDTVSDIVAVREGFDTDGTRCYERFIPNECFRITP